VKIASKLSDCYPASLSGLVDRLLCRLSRAVELVYLWVEALAQRADCVGRTGERIADMVS
jgi:hypothetical protein